MKQFDFDRIVSVMFFQFINSHDSDAKNFAKACGISKEELEELKENTQEDLNYLSKEQIITLSFDSTKFKFAQSKINAAKHQEEQIDLAIAAGASRANLQDLIGLSYRDFSDKRQKMIDIIESKTKPRQFSTQEIKQLDQAYKNIISDENMQNAPRLEKIIMLAQSTKISISQIMAFYSFNGDLFNNRD